MSLFEAQQIPIYPITETFSGRKIKKGWAFWPELCFAPISISCLWWINYTSDMVYKKIPQLRIFVTLLFEIKLSIVKLSAISFNANAGKR